MRPTRRASARAASRTSSAISSSGKPPAAVARSKRGPAVQAVRHRLLTVAERGPRLDEWRDAFTTLIDQGQTGAIKVAFDFR